VRRLGLGAVAAAAVASGVLALPSTFASFTQSQVNSVPLHTQTVFPPLNTVAPSIRNAVGGTLLSLPASGLSVQGRVGTWDTAHSGSTTYTIQWQRCTSGTCSDVGSPVAAGDLGAGVIGALYVIAPADAGSTLRIQVVATDNDASVTPHNATTALSAQAP
jgi:hypothetical protein